MRACGGRGGGAGEDGEHRGNVIAPFMLEELLPRRSDGYQLPRERRGGGAATPRARRRGRSNGDAGGLSQEPGDEAYGRHIRFRRDHPRRWGTLQTGGGERRRLAPVLEQMCGSWPSVRLLCNRRPLACGAWVQPQPAKEKKTKANGLPNGAPPLFQRSRTSRKQSKEAAFSGFLRAGRTPGGIPDAGNVLKLVGLAAPSSRAR